MHENLESQPRVPRPPSNTPSNLFGNALYDASSELIQGGLSTYGERIFGDLFKEDWAHLESDFSVQALIMFKAM